MPPAKDKLFRAIRSAQPKALAEVLAAGAPVDARDPHGRTALYRVTEENPGAAVELARQLLDAGADPTLKPKPRDWSALHQAAFHGRGELVRLLAEAGVDVDAQDNRKRAAPLHVAVNGEAMSALLDAGADPEALDGRGNTPLLTAITHPSEAVPEALIVERVEVLLESEVALESRDREGYTALLKAASVPLPAVVDRLLEAGAEVDAVHKTSGTALHRAAANDQVELIDRLVEAGADIDSTAEPSGLTPLALAAVLGRARAVEGLLARGADPSIADDKGKTALDYARSDEVRGLLEAAR